jgi:hypothetical protein
VLAKWIIFPLADTVPTKIGIKEASRIDYRRGM